MKGYLYIEDNRVVVNPEKKPDATEYINKYCPRKKYIPIQYSKAVKEWRSNHIEVENAFKHPSLSSKIEWRMAGWLPYDYETVSVGQPCEYELTDKGATVNKLI